jgi:pilus assembly protein CpaE
LHSTRGPPLGVAMQPTFCSIQLPRISSAAEACCSMIIFLVSESSNSASRLRHLLSQGGHECPFNHVATYAAAPDAAAAAQPIPDLIVFVMSGETEHALEALRRLRESPGGHILAIGPRDSNMILGAVRAGAQDYLEEDGDLQSGLSAALTRISESVQKRSPSGHLTTVVSASGGCGRTLIATNLAVSLAKAHRQCGLFDFDLHGSDVATFFGLKPRHTVADLCRNIETLDQKMWEQSLLVHETAVSVLAGPETWDDAQQVSADGLQRILRFGRALFPQVVVDMDSFWLNERAPMLLESTTILLLMRLDFAAVRNATRAVQYLAKIGVPSANVQLAVARYVKTADITPSQAEAALGMKIQHFVPEDAQLANASIDCGVPIVTESPRSPFSKAVGSIAAALAHAGQATEKQIAVVEDRIPTPLIGMLRTFLKLSVRECVLKAS